MKILSIDTCTKSASCTILNNGQLMGHFLINANRTHSETLLPIMQQMLSSINISISDIDIFACSIGPGSFTGNRIGSSIIKGFCLSLNKKCVGVSSLLGLAYNAIDLDTIVMPVLDAKKSQIYTAIFKIKNKNIERISEDIALDIDKFLEFSKNINQEINLLGDAAQIIYDKYKDKKSLNILSANCLYNSSLGISLAAFEDVQKNNINNNVNPVYLRKSQAETEIKNKRN